MNSDLEIEKGLSYNELKDVQKANLQEILQKEKLTTIPTINFRYFTVSDLEKYCKEVLDLLLLGKNPDEIASEIKTTSRTVYNIMNKIKFKIKE